MNPARSTGFAGPSFPAQPPVAGISAQHFPEPGRCIKRLCSLLKAAICYKALTQLFCEQRRGHASQSGGEDREQLTVLEPHMDAVETDVAPGPEKDQPPPPPPRNRCGCEAKASAGGQQGSPERAGRTSRWEGRRALATSTGNLTPPFAANTSATKTLFLPLWVETSLLDTS